MNSDIEALADELVNAQLTCEPLEAALLGLHNDGAPLADLRDEVMAEFQSTFRSIAARANALADDGDSATWDEMDILTLDLVRFTAASLADRLEVPTLQFTLTDFEVAPFSGLLSVLGQLGLDSDERRDEQLARLAVLPTFLAQVAEQHRTGVRTGLTAVARGVAATIDQLDKVLADPAFGGLRRTVDGADDFNRDQDHLLDDVVAPALRTYRQVLASEILPAGRSDDQPGLCWLPGGDRLYDIARRYSTSTDQTSEDLHQLGLAIIDALHAQFAEVGARVWGTTDVAEIHHRLRSDPQLRFTTADEILDAAITTVRRAEAVAPQWFGETPHTPCAVKPIPEALAEGSAPAYYYAGSLDGSRVGTYFINTSRPGERFRYFAEAVAFHEAVPGHHFQLTIAQELGVHLAHKLFGDVTTAEGWGLYAERLADEMGLYSDDIARLGLLSTDAWRAARLVLDTGLHALGWSRQQAIDWMTDHVPMSQVEVISEVDRYISMPGQALAYMVGRLEIEGLRARASLALAERFDVRDFHDLVLRCGPVSPPALSAAVTRWLDAQSASVHST